MRYYVAYAESREDLTEKVNQKICCGYEVVDGIHVVDHGNALHFYQVLLNKYLSPHECEEE